MYLYLIRHGDAKPEHQDPARPLSEKGSRDVTNMASFISSHLNPTVDLILHSGKLRAAQTAEIISRYFNPPDGVEEAEGLAPLDDPKKWAKELKDLEEDMILVGHLPHLGSLASLLLVGDPDAVACDFPSASVLCLKEEESRWSVVWMLTPQLIPAET